VIEVPPREVLEERATRLAHEDYALKYVLVDERVKQGITQEDVGHALGWPLDEVREFEAYWSDPTMSQIRRYALAVNMSVRHVAARESEAK
jgi:hypothetical protein